MTLDSHEDVVGVSSCVPPRDKALRTSAWEAIMTCNATESEARLYNFSHEYRLQLPGFAIKTTQMPSLDAKVALNAIFP